MLTGEVFSLNIPHLPKLSAETGDIAPIADGCASNSNYYTDGLSRGTCCCGCDKPAF